ncbi:MAG: hypothetical protein ABSB19_17545 [Methylomonas sp.]|jgi:hypothetical protein
MADEKDQKSGLFSSYPAGLLLIALAGSLFVTQDAFHESRPDRPDMSAPSAAGQENVDARIWQDPFEMIDRRPAGQVGEKTGERNPAGQLSPEDCGALAQAEHTLQKVFNPECSAEAKQFRDGPHIAVAVMLPGGAYFEDSESRRRLRYAVLSGFLAALGYTPKDTEHIGYFNHRISSGFNSKIAFEWLVWKPQPVYAGAEHPPILLLYLNNDDFSGTPYAHLQNLFAEFERPPLDWQPPLIWDWDINVLGPASSDVLQQMAREVKNRSSADSPANFKLYSPRATVDENKLLNYQSPENKQKYSDLRHYFADQVEPDFFTRTTATDNEMAVTLAEELALRGVTAAGRPAVSGQTSDRPGFARGKHVVLISEQDTLYAWHIGETYAEAITRRYLDCGAWTQNVPERCLDENRKIFAKTFIHHYSYFRGLDGESPHKSANTGAGGQDKQATADAANKSQALEDATGDSQFDYIRRLLDRLIELNGRLEREGGNIKAIGILGEDVYDKLLVLEAIQETFPQALIFSNDLDARFLQPDRNKWARNLIVVSRFGLELPDGLQKQIPPFRDSTQTGYFWTTQMLLAKTAAPLSPDAECLFEAKNNAELLSTINKYYIDNPVLHEIGRTKPFRLRPSEKFPFRTAEADGPDSRPCYHSDRTTLWFTPYHLAKLVLGVIVVGVLVINVVKQYFLQRLRATVNYPIKNRVTHFQKIWTLLMLSIGMAAVLLLLVWPANVTEPLAWLEGVSMWPTEAIQYIALILAVYYFIEVKKFDGLMREQFEIHFQLALDAAQAVLTSGEEFITECLTEIKACRPKNLFYIGGAGLAWLLIWIFDVYHMPYRGSNAPFRGDFIHNLDALLFSLLAVVFTPLFIGITNAVQSLAACIQYKTRDEQNLRWPDAVCRRYQTGSDIGNDLLHDWVTIRLIGELTERASALILYPFIVASLVVVLAYWSYFDNWIMHPGMKVGLGLIFAYLFYCDFRLKTEAEAAEKKAIQRLRYQEIFHRAGHENADLAMQLEKLIAVAEQYAAGAYKPFFKRPIFQGCLLLILTVAIGYSDYSTLVMTLLK